MEIPQPVVFEVGSAGYCDDCYALGNGTRSLKVVEEVTDAWLLLTGQEMNPSKSVVFGTNDPDPVELLFCEQPLRRPQVVSTLVSTDST